MADTIVSAVVGDAVTRGINLLTSLFGQQESTEAKLRRLCHLLTRISSVVEEAKGRQLTNHGALQWLSELIDGEYKGRYLLDTIVGSEHELEDEDGHDKVALRPPHASSSSSMFNPAKRIRVTACAVRSILMSRISYLAVDEIDSVLESLQSMSADLGQFIMLLQGYQPIRRPLATNIFVDGQMFGRHVEKERIINFLLHDSNSHSGRDLGVLPIVGDIGVGKTTLVQHICDDARVRNHFRVITLFNFSCIFSTYTAASTEDTLAIRSTHVIGDAGTNLNDPVQLIKENFGNKRFLMIFENVDMRKKKMLEELLPSMKCYDKNGSKIIITTNNRSVASMGTVKPIMLKFLPCPEYWFFFKAYAFAGRDAEENPSLVAAGKAIARKLNGSFFGAKIVGGLLKDHPDPKFWFKVLASNIGGLSLLGDGVAYIADLAQTLLPGAVDMFEVTVSKDRFRSQIELTRFKDLCEAPDFETNLSIYDKFDRVLLCKSVLPFFNRYYTASCIIGSAFCK